MKRIVIVLFSITCVSLYAMNSDFRRCDMRSEFNTVIEHEPITSVDEGLSISNEHNFVPVKNILLKAPGGLFFLCLIGGNNKINLKSIKKLFGISSIRFARLDEAPIEFQKGGVTPLLLPLDLEHKIEVLIDSELPNMTRKMGFHLNDNCSTVLLTFNEVLDFFNEYGITYKIFNLKKDF